MSSICRIISKYIGSCAHQQRCSSLLKSSRQTGLCSIIAYSDKCGSKKGSDSSGSKKGKEPSEPCPPPCPCNPCPCNPNPCDPWCCNPCPPCPPCSPCDNEPVAYSTMYDRRKYGHNLPANNVNIYFPPLACFPTGVFRDTDCEVLGLGAGKCGFYKNPEYFSYHHMSYYDMHLLIRPFRRPAPETNRKP